MSNQTIPLKCPALEELYAKDQNLKKEDVQALKKWSKKHLHLPQMTDLEILVFLHSCYYDVEKSKTTIANYFRTKELLPVIFEPLCPEVLKLTMSCVFIDVLPKLKDRDVAYCLFKLLEYNAENFNLANVLTFMNMAATISTFQNGFSSEVIVVLDVDGFNWRHLMKLNINLIKHALYYLQEAAPIRLRSVYIINTMPIIGRIFALIRPFLKGELFQMLKFYPPNSEDLYASLCRECLPQEYGGTLPTIQDLKDKNLKNLLENYEFFEWYKPKNIDISKPV